MERQCSYLSSGTLRFEICLAIGPQWLFENDGPGKGQKVSDTSIFSSSSLVRDIWQLMSLDLLTCGGLIVVVSDLFWTKE